MVKHFKHYSPGFLDEPGRGLNLIVYAMEAIAPRRGGLFRPVFLMRLQPRLPAGKCAAVC